MAASVLALIAPAASAANPMNAQHENSTRTWEASPHAGTTWLDITKGTSGNEAVGWTRISKAPDNTVNTDTTCSTMQDGVSLLCVATGPLEPTTVWVDNRTGYGYWAQLGVQGSKIGTRWGGSVYIEPYTIEGAQWTGFPNDCFYGLVYDGNVIERTHAPACV